jgi:hypothetical protein
VFVGEVVGGDPLCLLDNESLGSCEGIVGAIPVPGDITFEVGIFPTFFVGSAHCNASKNHMSLLTKSIKEKTNLDMAGPFLASNKNSLALPVVAKNVITHHTPKTLSMVRF